MMKGVTDRFQDVEVLQKGSATLKKFSISREEAANFNLRLLMGGGRGFECVIPGDYMKLYVDGELMMSDTSMERNTNRKFVENAHGRVMIAGLGIGLILNALSERVEKGEVSSIVVYEKCQDVIDIVGPRYKDLPLEIRCEDILSYKPKKDERYDTIYFDIWPTVCEENLKEIAVLHQRWKTHKEKGGWMDSWMSDYLRAERKAYNRTRYGW